MEELLPYYERELAFLRRYSRDFADKYPKIAARLAMSAEASEDPHVERMIESFALLTARIHRKLDDDYPEFTDALLEVLYPHYLRPFPSCSIAQFDAGNIAGQATAASIIPRGTELTSRQISGVACRFRTAFDVALAPVNVAKVRFEGVVRAPANTKLPVGSTGCISIQFDCLNQQATFESLKLAQLRLFIDGEPSFTAALRDSLFMNVLKVYVEPASRGVWHALPANPLKPVGFDERESLIDYPARSHPAYRLLTEYFAFPDKFNFFDIQLAQILKEIGNARQFTLHLVLSEVRADSDLARILEPLSAKNLRLGCSPVVNLFKQRGEPIRLTHATSTYPVVADARKAFAYEVYSIDSVKMVRQTNQGESITEFLPFYSLRHGETPEQASHYWFARRNEIVASTSPGYETEISIVDIDLDPSAPQTDTLSIELTCTNRELPANLSFGASGGDLFLEGGSTAKTINLLRKPSQALQFERGRAAHWRLISHLSLNHLSIIQSGIDALKEMLRLYNINRSASSIQHIEGLTTLDYKPATAWLPGNPFATFVRGLEIRLTVDEDSFVGSGLEVFAAIMDRFFGLYVHVNSFIQLIIISKRTGEELFKCPPRSGESILA
jgi:type VI secretion system protein ImpG